MPNGQIPIVWGDGEHEFNIAKIGQIFELEEKCDAGISEIFTRLRESRWKLNDVRETIRLGLIGGGKTPVDALKLTKRYVDERPLLESVQVALAIHMAAMIGVPGDEVGKPQAEGTATETVTPASSAPQSTASEPPSTSRPDKSMNSLSGNSRPVPTATTKPTAESSSPSP